MIIINPSQKRMERIKMDNIKNNFDLVEFIIRTAIHFLLWSLVFSNILSSNYDRAILFASFIIISELQQLNRKI